MASGTCFFAESGAIGDLDLERAVRLLLVELGHRLDAGRDRARWAEEVVVPDRLLGGRGRRPADRGGGEPGGGDRFGYDEPWGSDHLTPPSIVPATRVERRGIVDRKSTRL